MKTSKVTKADRRKELLDRIGLEVLESRLADSDEIKRFEDAVSNMIKKRFDENTHFYQIFTKYFGIGTEPSPTRKELFREIYDEGSRYQSKAGYIQEVIRWGTRLLEKNKRRLWYDSI